MIYVVHSVAFYPLSFFFFFLFDDIWLVACQRRYIRDLARASEQSLADRQTLEADWRSEHEKKLQREREDEEHRKAVEGLVLVEQLAHCERCVRCKRDTHNTGQSFVAPSGAYMKASHEIF